ncbi:hypothetical protein PMAYCL1PPCAC_09521, partial [Pristionchus mayeri]
SILPSLLLGCRVRDFEQNSVVVEQLRPLTLLMPPHKGLEGTYELGGSNPMLKIELKSTTGEIFDVLSKRIHVKKGEKQWTVVCYQEPLPSKVVIGSQLEIMTKQTRESFVVQALREASWKNSAIGICSRSSTDLERNASTLRLSTSRCASKWPKTNQNRSVSSIQSNGRLWRGTMTIPALHLSSNLLPVRARPSQLQLWPSPTKGRACNSSYQQ